MKRNKRTFWTLDRCHDAGFTLVELIVVIAVLAILAAVAVPAYSGYITKANMTADRQLVGDIIYAAELYSYVIPLNGSAAIAVFSDGTPASTSGDAAAWLNEAMINTFGAGWENSLQLKHDWGKSAAVSQDTISYFVGVVADSSASKKNQYLSQIYNGTAKPTFSNEVNELFGLIESTAVDVGGRIDGMGGAELVQNAAGYTLNADIEEFANAWNSQAWSNSILMGTNGGEYNGDIAQMENEDVLKGAVANAAVLKARNTAVANYLSQKGYGAAYDLIANLTYGSTIVPDDAYNMLRTRNPELWYPVLGAILGVTVNAENIASVETQYQQQVLAFMDAISSYSTPANGGYSPAMIDAAAYYAMMDTVSNVNRGNSDDETYWDEMAGAVSLYGDIAQGKVTLNDLETIYTGTALNNAVSIIVTATKEGMKVTPSPLSILPEA